MATARIIDGFAAQRRQFYDVTVGSAKDLAKFSQIVRLAMAPERFGRRMAQSTIFWPVASQSFRKAARPLSVRGCERDELAQDLGRHADHISAQTRRLDHVARMARRGDQDLGRQRVSGSCRRSRRFRRSAIDPACGVDLPEGREDTRAHTKTQGRCGPRESGRLAEHDPVVEHAWFRVRGTRQNHARGEPERQRSEFSNRRPAEHLCLRLSRARHTARLRLGDGRRGGPESRMLEVDSGGNYRVVDDCDADNFAGSRATKDRRPSQVVAQLIDRLPRL
jgi:hypothetical protein